MSTAGIAFLGTSHRRKSLPDIPGHPPHSDITDDVNEEAPQLLEVAREFCLINTTLRVPLICCFELYETDYAKMFGIN